MRLCCTVAAILSATALAPAKAQLTASRDQPIDITGDMAEFLDNKTIWTGNVRVLQGEGILTAERLEADLNAQGDFETITASGAIRYSNGKENITGERAIYDAIERTITIMDDVIVTQGKQVMSAGTVIYWIDSGKVRFKPESGKRIRGIFYTKSGDSPL